ncbi:MAG: hypothetical protein ABR969_01250 [Sedimentisphaerales bacterium]|jgi:hypothetical protein
MPHGSHLDDIDFDFFALFWNDLPLFFDDFGVFLNTVIGYQIIKLLGNGYRLSARTTQAGGFFMVEFGKKKCIIKYCLV